MTRIIQVGVLIMTTAVLAVNYLSAAGLINNRDAGEISAIYPTAITPAGYAFAIWSLIYLGTIFFSIYQILPVASENGLIGKIRIPYLLLCAANIGWIFCWHYEMIPVAMVLMLVLLATLAKINVELAEARDNGEIWFAGVPFSIYFGWITLATVLNLTILLSYWGLSFGPAAESYISAFVVAIAAIIGIVIRFRIDSTSYPLAIAWGVTAIGVEQSGSTILVLTAALAMMALIFFALWGFVKDR